MSFRSIKIQNCLICLGYGWTKKRMSNCVNHTSIITIWLNCLYNHENDNYPSLIVCNNWRSPVVSQRTLTSETGRNSLFPAQYLEESNFSSHLTSRHWRAAEWCSLCPVLVRAGLPAISAGNCLTFNNQHITLLIKLCF